MSMQPIPQDVLDLAEKLDLDIAGFQQAGDGRREDIHAYIRHWLLQRRIEEHAEVDAYYDRLLCQAVRLEMAGETRQRASLHEEQKP